MKYVIWKEDTLCVEIKLRKKLFYN